MSRSHLKTLATCEGNYVLQIQDPTDGAWGTIACPGCSDCDRGQVALRTAAAGKFEGLAQRVPVYVEEAW